MSETSFKEDFLKRGFSKGIKRERKSPLDEYFLEINELYKDGYTLKTIYAYLVENKQLEMTLSTFSSTFRRLRKKKGLDSSKEQTKKQVESKGE